MSVVSLIAILSSLIDGFQLLSHNYLAFFSVVLVCLVKCTFLVF